MVWCVVLCYVCVVYVCMSVCAVCNPSWVDLRTQDPAVTVETGTGSHQIKPVKAPWHSAWTRRQPNGGPRHPATFGVIRRATGPVNVYVYVYAYIYTHRYMHA